MGSTPIPPTTGVLPVPEIEAIEIEARGLRFPAYSCGRGPLVLLQHGFPDLPDSFRTQLQALARAGYRAVAPTLRGYHRACMPALRDVHVLAAAEDLCALVPALGAERAALLGHDWGALATYLAVASRPSRFSCAITAAIPYLGGLLPAVRGVPRQLLRSWYQVFFTLPGLPETWFVGGSRRVVDWAFRHWSPGFEAPDEQLSRIAQRLDDPPVQAAALAYYRALLRPGPHLREVLRLAREPLRIPLLCLYGERDGCMDARLQPLAARASNSGPLHVEGFADAGHFLHMEQPARFDARVLSWLADHYPAGDSP